MKLIFALIFALIMGPLFWMGCSETREKRQQVIKYPNGKIQQMWVEQLSEDGGFVKHGYDKQFYETNEPKSSRQWVDGKLHGDAVAWYPGGKEKWIKRYEHGQKTGIWQLNLPYKDMVLTLHYDNNQLTGPARFAMGGDQPVSYAAQFNSGRCVSGDCDFFSNLEKNIPLDTKKEEKVLQEFLNHQG